MIHSTAIATTTLLVALVTMIIFVLVTIFMTMDECCHHSDDKVLEDLVEGRMVSTLVTGEARPVPLPIKTEKPMPGRCCVW